jgi:hypothetical protein
MNDTAPRLGPLEARIMQVLWSCDPGEYAPIREVLRRLDDDLAYTTAMTVLSRFARQGAGATRRRTAPRATPPRRCAGRCTLRRTAALLRFAADLDADDAAALRRLLDGGAPGSTPPTGSANSRRTAPPRRRNRRRLMPRT